MKATVTLKSSERMYVDNRVSHVFEETAADGEDARDRPVTDPTDLKFVGRVTAAAIEAAGFTARDVAEKAVSYRMLVDADVNPGVAAKIRRWHSLQWSFESGEGLDRRSEQIRGLQDDERAWVASSYGEEAAEEGGKVDSESDGETLRMTDSDATEQDGLSADVDAEAAWVAASKTGARDADADEDRFAAETNWVRGATADASSGPGGRNAGRAERTGSGFGTGGASADDADGVSTGTIDGIDAGSGIGTTDGTDASADGSGDPVAAEAAWRERSKPTPLTELAGIGEVTAARLGEAGVTSVRSLATADPELLADVTGLPTSRIRTWFDEATDRVE